jgi:23S rRNA (guanosine2251-2'-O)-methyltransferase
MQSIIAGRKPVMEALKSGTRIEKIVFLVGVQGNVIRELRALADRHSVPVTQANKQEFRELAPDQTTQGVVALVQSRTFAPLDEILTLPSRRGEKGFVLILDGIEDPHNLGALIRTAECTGVHGVILPKHNSAPITSTVVKASAGATEHVAMTEVTNITATLEELKKEGYWIVGLDGESDRLYTDVDYAVPVGLVIGSEGKGIRRLVRDHCDHLVLNASVAGALAMYEVARRRRA